jgi:protein-S-isoprenylcysteine O-methyltransferase Ste14
MTTTDRPNLIPWPPILYAGTIAAALLADRVVPLGFGSDWRLRAAGGALLALGLLLDLAAISTLKRHGTIVRPDRPATTLVTSGPYGLSRNPIYLGNTIALLGAALLFDLAWLALLILPCTWLVHRLAVLREEVHLAARFAGEWTRYAARVRRWI